MPKNKLIHIEPTTEQNQFCREYLIVDGIAKRGKFDGDKLRQFIGLRGQIIVGDLLGLPRPKKTNKFDGGFDIEVKGLKLDVKVELRNVPFRKNYVHNLSKFQINYNCDGYIFLSYNQSAAVYTICGWIDKESFKKKACLYRTGEMRPQKGDKVMVTKSDFYEIKQEDLNNFIQLK